MGRGEVRNESVSHVMVESTCVLMSRELYEPQNCVRTKIKSDAAETLYADPLKRVNDVAQGRFNVTRKITFIQQL